ITAAALACTLGASAPANAVFVARICNDLMCTGGDDIIVQDNAAGDTIAASGAISFSATAFGYTLLVNTSQSKPMLGSATSPQLDLTFSATSNGSAGNIFLYASDTDFVASGGTIALTIGGTNSGGSGSDQGRAWGGTSNTEFQFSGANLLASLGPLTTSAFAASAGGTFAPTTDPYSLTIGTTISRTTAGTSTGDLNLQILAVPEPSTWALVLMGPALIAFVTRRRSRR
ncbi:MAG TPA: PEP-CTERM sorting domain-containing protein, partial [Caldimonas sp.]